MKISGVYKIVNTITNDFYIGSSKDVKQRWANHKCPSTWKKCPNIPMYLDMQKYGVDKFDFQILATTEPDNLKETEQQFIEMLKPTYNSCRAKGLDGEKRKKHAKKYYQKNKEYIKEYYQKNKEYRKEYMKEYHQSEKYKEHRKKYCNQLCSYNGETLTLNALSQRFRRTGIENPTLEAKKYLLNKI